eukprot:TRINITY_DN658_c0_g1_i7.p1 TRINITY_DN658_c0_g1~~TRINITY_DN658_c0_g1_i7.p1  ORF type:complete len:107 (-),score=7.07 TRINITY_DN658_c0_g1_i7:651-971(-)
MGNAWATQTHYGNRRARDRMTSLERMLKRRFLHVLTKTVIVGTYTVTHVSPVTLSCVEKLSTNIAYLQSYAGIRHAPLKHAQYRYLTRKTRPRSAGVRCGCLPFGQ